MHPTNDIDNGLLFIGTISLTRINTNVWIPPPPTPAKTLPPINTFIVGANAHIKDPASKIKIATSMVYLRPKIMESFPQVAANTAIDNKNPDESQPTLSKALNLSPTTLSKTATIV